MTLDPELAGALRAQLGAWRAALAAGAERVGWKVGGGIAEIEAVTGGEPVFGHLTSATRLAPGGAFSAAGVRDLRVDCELAVRGGEYAVALELVDVGRPPGGTEALVAANVMHRAFVLGPFRDTHGALARCFVGGELRAEAPVRDPAAGMEAVRRVLAQLGEALLATDVVITGSLTQVPVAPGDRIAVEIDGLGRLDATVVP